jgi:putative transferase (TIGR04331 family)
MHSLVLGRFPTLWPKSGTAVLIDDYCINKEISVLTQEVSFKIATSHFKNQKYNDDLYDTIVRLHDVYFKELAKKLNIFHGEDNSDRYWGLIFSHWLMRCIEDLVKTYTEVLQTINEHNFSNVAISNSRINDLTPNNSYDYARLRLKEEYIVILRSEVIRFLNPISDETTITEQETENKTTHKFDSEVNIRARILTNVNRFIWNWTQKITQRAKIYVISSYLPFWSELLLKISLNQSPAIRIQPLFKFKPRISQFRYHLFDGARINQPLEEFVSSQIRWLLPRTYLEDYKALKNLIDESGWPEKPKVIFTANSFDTDDEFKIWSAEKIHKGSLYVVMQHGNNFGTYRYGIYPEMRLADYFLTWGWSNHPNEIPLFCQTIKSGKSYRLKKSESLLILRRQVPIRESLTDHPNMLRELLREENDAFESLKTEIRSTTIFKNHTSSKYKSDIFDFESESIELEKKYISDHVSIRKLYPSYKLVFFQCYSTGVLECLSLNVPIVFIWPEGFSSIRSECVKDFIELEKTHILFFSGAKAAAHINSIWSDVDAWWKDPEVQDVRRKFVDKYAKSTDRPIRDLRKKLKEIERICA